MKIHYNRSSGTCRPGYPCGTGHPIESIKVKGCYQMTVKQKKNHVIKLTILIFLLVCLLAEEPGKIIWAAEGQDYFPGITEMKKSYTKNHPFRILEIVEDSTQAELGAYISGQEPFVKMEGYESLEDGLSKLDSREKREDFANNQLKDSDGTRKYRDFTSVLTGEEQQGPLNYSEYEEEYFLTAKEKKDGWKQIRLAEKETIVLKGSYEKTEEGTGDFTKEERYFIPAYEGDEKEEEPSYRENIYGFTCEDKDADKPYEVIFSAVSENVKDISLSEIENKYYDYKNGQYGLYEKIYQEVRKELELPEDTQVYTAETQSGFPAVQYSLLYDSLDTIKEKVQKQEAGYGIDSLGNYYVEEIETSDSSEEQIQTVQKKLYYVSGYRMVPCKEIHTEYEGDYYYTVSDVSFSCRKADETDTKEAQEQGYVYEGSYSAIHPAKEEAYVKTEEEDGTAQSHYYISDPVYEYTPEAGDYTFVQDENGEETEHIIDRIYYKGGFSNNDWMKKYVFHLKEEDYDNFSVEVDTRTVSELKDTDFSSYQSFFISGGNLDSNEIHAIEEEINEKKACIINWDQVSQNIHSGAYKLAQKLLGQDGSISHSFVTGSVYFFSKADAVGENAENLSFVNRYFSQTLPSIEGFSSMNQYIASENILRELEGKERLSDEISQARVLEYVFTYSYKRTLIPKDNICILEIEPGGSYSLNQNRVLSWLGYEDYGDLDKSLWRISSDCGEDEDYPLDNIIDGQQDTYWLSGAHEGSGTEGHSHSFLIDLYKEQTFSGFRYCQYPVGIESADETEVSTGMETSTLKEYEFWISNDKKEWQKIQSGIIETDTDNREAEVFFDAHYSARYVKVVYGNEQDGGSGISSGSETSSSLRASCAEFTLFREKQTEETESKSPKVTIEHMSSAEFVGNIDDLNTKYDLIYLGMNTDGFIIRNGKTDYADDQLDGMAYTHTGDLFSLTDVDGLRTSYLSEAGQDASEKYRLSGNDITKAGYKGLLDFIKSGAPVVLEDSFFQVREQEGKVLNEEKIDNSSWIYQFAAEASKNSNLLTQSEISDSARFLYYLNLPKPGLVLTKKPVDVTGSEEAERYLKVSDDNRACLEYTFSIEDQSAVHRDEASYDVKLYVDKNADGKYSEKTEALTDILVTDSSGNKMKIKKGHYALKQNQTYHIKRQVPKGYQGVISWKLEVIRNQGTGIRASETGYAAVDPSASDTVSLNVLQIIKSDGTTNLNCRTDTQFQEVLKAAKGFDFHFTVKTQEEVKNWSYGMKKDGESSECFQSYDMIILGFADEHNGLIEGSSSVKALKEYIQSGHAVIVTHDTTQSVNDSFTRELQDIIGMDRYGVTDSELAFLKKGKVLDSGTEIEEWNRLVDSGRDIAYVAGSHRTKAYGEVQGMSTAGFDRFMSLLEQGEAKYLPVGSYIQQDNQDWEAQSVTLVNQGQITSYPYSIDTEQISVASTHSQWLQLDLERDKDQDGESDLTVWGTLTGTDVYRRYGNDVRNHYYLYTNGNVIYSGLGHSEGMTREEIRLFVNTLVAAYQTGVKDPEVTVIENKDVNSREIQTQFLPIDESLALEKDESAGILDSDLDIFYKVNDNDFSGTNSGVNISYYIEAPENAEGAQKILGEDGPYGIPIEAACQKTKSSEGTVIKAEKENVYQVDSGKSYCLTLSGLSGFMKGKDSFKVYITARTDPFSYYGKTVTRSAYAEVTIRKQQLFDLD